MDWTEWDETGLDWSELDKTRTGSTVVFFFTQTVGILFCREVGIECQEVPGHSKGIGYRQGCSLRGVKSDHLWNAVLLGQQWFLLDACWGAGRVDMERQCFVKR